MSESNHCLRDEHRWRAVVERRTLGRDHFVYAVKTTGIYCLPTCPSRRPKQQNVRFFEDSSAAAAAGFRACKRCRPDQIAAGGHADMVAKACRRIEQDEQEPSLAALAEDASLSPSHFQRLFKAEIGLSPKGYAKAVRAERFRHALDRGTSVTTAIYEAGYSAPSRAYEAGASTLGMTPTSWQRGGAGEYIRYAIGDCDLGKVLVAGTPRGVCLVALDDSREALLEAFAQRFPRAERTPADAEFQAWFDAILCALDTPSAEITIPLDIRGTAFQQRVWNALRQIPPGTTVSYGELANMIGRPTAARAVAQACANNPIAVAIPCHRVVRSDGALSGYRWGSKRKRALIAREARAGRIE